MGRVTDSNGTGRTDGRTDRNILIVDDDRDTCDLLEMLFRINGYQTSVVYSGCEALRSLESVSPDLVILDIMMPDMDGWQVIEKLRDISNVPVLFLTALTSGEAAARALQLGATDFVRKPYPSPELLARVDVLLDRNHTWNPPLNIGRNNPILSEQLSITAVIPAYNEERFIGSVVLKARKYAQSVIVVDDGSRDATAQVAKAAGAMVLSHTFNQGKGTALNTAFSLLRDQLPQVVVMLDGDGQHLPEELAVVVEPVLKDQADIVIGSRYIEKKSQVPRHRIFGHRVFNWMTRIASGVPTSDSQSGYRAFSPKAVKFISFHSSGFSVESEMQFIARENNLRLIEVPITIRYDDPPKRSVIAHGLIVLNGILHMVGQYRPLLFFGVPGMSLMLIGFTWGLWVVDIYVSRNELAIGYAMVSVLLSVIGLIMLSTGFILHSVRGLLTGMLQRIQSR